MRVSRGMGFVLVSSALVAGPVWSESSGTESPVIAGLRSRLVAETTAADLARSLATEVGPRLAGSEGDRRGVAWATARLKQLGFEKVRAEPVTVPHWERGSAAASIVSPYPQRIEIAALGGSIATPAGGLEAEIVATSNLASLASLPDEAVRGRIVYLSEKTERAIDGAGYGRTGKNRWSGAVEAAKRGAAALLVRSLGTDSSRMPHTGGMSSEFVGAPIPAAALSTADAELLDEIVRRGNPVRVRMELTCRKLPDQQSANVIGEFRGRELPDEIVLLGAHLDSWDLGTGALDDATGVGLVIAVARAIGDLPQRPRRTVRVVLFANEEFGLSGGKAYAAEHAAELGKHQAALESDLGTGRAHRFRSHVAASDAAIFGELAQLVAPLGVEADPSKPAHGGADLSPMRKLGVPVFDLSHDATDYFDFHHTANDTADKIVPETLAQATAAFAVVTWQLAERPQFLARAPVEDPVE